MGKFIDLTGRRFFRLTVLSIAETRRNSQGKTITMWRVHCDCGNELVVSGGSLRSGNTKSCGCFNKQRTHETQATHGLSRTRIYTIWSGIKQRCYNSKSINYDNYGLRGIGMCDEWRNDFQAFYNWAMMNGYNAKLSIDRIDNEKDYAPYNCRWVDMPTQEANKRPLKRNTSGYTGIGWDKENSKWRATVSFNGKEKRLGRYNTIEEALAARNKFIVDNHLPHPIQEYKINDRTN